jgi:2-polyprenyl-6-methoxyphenol hydroxylase-like FAD-dependent oxidoreductase
MDAKGFYRDADNMGSRFFSAGISTADRMAPGRGYFDSLIHAPSKLLIASLDNVCHMEEVDRLVDIGDVRVPNHYARSSGADDKSHSVLIVGAGPTGLSLALGLARSGVKCTVLEQKGQLDPHSRATVILPRTLEIFAQWCILDCFVEAGNRVAHVRLRRAPRGEQIVHFDFTDLTDDTATPFAIALPQDRTERLLLDAVTATGLADIRFDTKVLGFEQDARGIKLRAQSPEGEYELGGDFLVGADGAHSVVRETLGLELEGKTYPTRALLADLRVPPEMDQTEFWPALLDEGLVVGIRFRDGIFRIVADAVDESVDDKTIDEHVDRLARRLFGVAAIETIWRRIYQKHQRCAPRFRVGRALLAGDAAHLNSPAGGQGMNSGIQDAHNLAWKLARAVADPGANVDALLDSYAEERWGYVDRVVQPTTDMMERFESAPTFLRVALVWFYDNLLGVGHSAPAVTRRVSMLDVVYDRSAMLKSKGPVGSRVPDVIGGDGHRLLGDQWSAVVLHARCEEAARRLAGALEIPLIDGDVANLAKFFGHDRYVALVRPDRIVRWLSDGEVVDIEACTAALGIDQKIRNVSTVM